MSTNKVYGDTPNKLPLVELDTRWDYSNPEDMYGITETRSEDIYRWLKDEEGILAPIFFGN